MKIAIIGSGISGLTSAYLLSREHDVTIYEKDNWVGGHTHTYDVNLQGEQQTIDTGFIVFNEVTYPNFCKLLNELQVAYEPTDMSFSIFCQQSKMAYNSSGLRGYFNRGKQLCSYHHWYLLYEINNFNRQAKTHLKNNDEQITLLEFLTHKKFSSYFQRFYLGPLIASIWSMPPEKALALPAVFLFRFLSNHGLLTLSDKLPWHVIKNGSRSYVDALIKNANLKILTNHAVRKIARFEQHVIIYTEDDQQSYDKVVIATHSDQALTLLDSPQTLEYELLTSVPYQNNYVTLHTDTRLMPPKKSTWASWNYFIPSDNQYLPKVNYHMNKLQNIQQSQHDFFVTLSQEDSTAPIDNDKIIASFVYQHPIFSDQNKIDEKSHAQLNGQNNTYYCGAYWRYGFHEDGVISALNVASKFGIYL